MITETKKKLKKIEKETHVHFDEYSLKATISTYNVKWINRLTKYGIIAKSVDDTGLHIFEDVPAHWLIPRKPPKRTETQIEASKRNMQRLLGNQEDVDGEEDDDDVADGDEENE